MSHYDPVIYSRMLTSLTLAFHIIYATIGVGVPMLIALAEWMGVKRKYQTPGNLRMFSHSSRCSQRPCRPRPHTS